MPVRRAGWLASPAGAAFEQLCENWENAKIGAQAGDSIDRDGATVTSPVVTTTTASGGKQAVSFDFAFKPDPAVKVLEAENAVLSGVNRYHDALASGGNAVGGFGNQPGDALAFDNVPTTSGLTVFYNNTLPHGWRPGAPARATQCGLYIEDRRVTTLKFLDAGGWFTPFEPVIYEGRVGGKVRLQVDPEDVAVNKGACCNVDKVVFGSPRLIPTIQVRLKLGETVLEEGMDYFNCAIRAPLGFLYQIGLEDAAAVQHWSLPGRHQRGDAWEHITIGFDEFKPRLHGEKARLIRAILIRASGDETGLKGTVALDEAKFAKGWPSNPPTDIPFQISGAFAAIRFTGRFKGYTSADNWFPSWASDGNLYSPYTDGVVENVFSLSSRAEATTGMAKIEGDDPLNLKVSSLGVYLSRPWPYSCRYPCASLIHNGIWYYGTQIVNKNGPDGSGLCQGPFVGFRTSNDYGKTWTETPRTPLNNLFEEEVDLTAGGLTRTKMSSPHFVDFGRNMEHSPDGKAYLVAHGCTRPASPQTWLRGDEIYLARVEPRPETINNRREYEFFAGYDGKGEAIWSKKFSEIKPMIDWSGRAGCVTITYDAPLKKYLMCVSNGETHSVPFDTTILESDRVSGPWRLITYMEQFGKQAYFVNVPSKFISKDGRTMWLCYSADWSGQPQNPKGSYYAMCLHEIQLIPAREAAPPKPSPIPK